MKIGQHITVVRPSGFKPSKHIEVLLAEVLSKGPQDYEKEIFKLTPELIEIVDPSSLYKIIIGKKTDKKKIESLRINGVIDKLGKYYLFQIIEYISGKEMNILQINGVIETLDATELVIVISKIRNKSDRQNILLNEKVIHKLKYENTDMDFVIHILGDDAKHITN